MGSQRALIQIRRADSAPATLEQLGSRQTERDCAAYEEAPEEYKSGRRRLSDKRYYSRQAVKDVLRKMHHDKCSYCETKLYTPAYLHVEHFRPKAAARQSRAEHDEYPGYYWLAYCWENLLLACFDCNTTHKGTLFPLVDPSQRARSHADDVSREREQFVNPSAEDPRNHIRFEGDLPVAQTERGRHIIEGLGLCRSSLTELRLQRIREVEVNIKIIQIIEAMQSPKKEAFLDDICEARSFVEKAQGPECQFSSMVMDFVAQQGC